MRAALPQPYSELDHTADVGVAVEGRSAEEALARLVLAQSALLSGGGEVHAVDERRVEVRAADRMAVAVECLRELLFAFTTAREIPAWCEVEAFDEAHAALRLGVGRWDADRHAEGVDLKAVTWHAARFAAGADGRWRAQVVFDI